MKILICGDRKWTDEQKIIDVLFPYVFKNPTIIHGAAKGADTIGGRIAKVYNLRVNPYRSDWSKHGKSAGPIRNRDMLKLNPDVVLAFHNNLDESKGTKDMISIAREAGIEVKVFSSD